MMSRHSRLHNAQSDAARADRIERELIQGSDTQSHELRAQLLMGAVHSNPSVQGCDQSLYAYCRTHALNQQLDNPLDLLTVAGIGR